MTTYADFVQSLRKNPAEIIETLTPEKMDAMHMAVGIAGEAFEVLEKIDITESSDELLDPENFVEESGDIHFYLTGFWSAIGETPKTIELNGISEINELQLHVAFFAGKILDYTKKWVVYDKSFAEVKTPLVDNAARLSGALKAMVENGGFSMKFVERYNRAKLTERYGEKYSDAAAHARADKAGD